VYLNNSNLKFRLDWLYIIETNPIQGIWVQRQALVSIVVKKVVLSKKKMVLKQEK
jgi:Cu(I)/Ag(I) efflux system membrane fusion protein